MDHDFACHHQIPFQELQEQRQVEVIDGTPIELGDITYVAKVRMMVQDHQQQLPMFVTRLGHYPMFLRIPWLRLHDVAVRIASIMVMFVSQLCTTPPHDAPIKVQGVMEQPPDPV